MILFTPRGHRSEIKQLFDLYRFVMFDIRNTYIFYIFKLSPDRKSKVKRYCFCTQFNTKIYSVISGFGVMI